ncbi:hypothetical protein Tsubulata_039420 [Turnera subulata]|uniref:F-box domain-containing protein n=1 Tax=Turnera subulata TaxID=218843 RepID=A0A9Q0JHM6_9ROSI|nr:hypothetical protein Tsubulata_039420 [Turnera subulata]
MDRGKRPVKSIAHRNSKIYMDLKDIIRENALAFLPAKAIRRCSIVCRDWKHMISMPFFVHNQSVAFRDISGFFCQSKEEPPYFISMEPLAYGVPDPSLKFLPEPVDIRSSSNGLLCCQGRNGYKAYYICNPVTQQWKKLPEPTAKHGADPAIVLAFQPSRLNFEAHYKLVCAFPSELGGYEFEIYSSANGSWKISDELFCGSRSLIPKSGTHIGGVVYWETSCRSYGGDIMAFDLTSERTSLIYGNGPLGQLGGKVCSASFSGYAVRVAELNAYCNTMQMGSKHKTLWKEFKITGNAHGGSYQQGKVLYVGDDAVVVRSGNHLFAYDMRTKESRQLTGQVCLDPIIVPYVNNLVPIY